MLVVAEADVVVAMIEVVVLQQLCHSGCSSGGSDGAGGGSGGSSRGHES